MYERFKRLLQADDECLFLNGACHVFALALHERFHYPLVLVLLADEIKQNVPHVFCRSSEFAVDVIGFTPEKQLVDAKQWNESRSMPQSCVIPVTRQELESHYVQTVPCPGLYGDELFLCEARLRAETRITHYMKFYDGTYRCGIIPHPFLEKPTSEEYDSILKSAR